MALAFLVAALFRAAPQDQGKSIEARLLELEARLTALEKRHQSLEAENRGLERKLTEVKVAWKSAAQQTADRWVTLYSKPLELTEKQAAELSDLWKAWMAEDLEASPDAARWKSREAALKGKLTPEQAPKLARAVRDEQEKNAKASLAGVAQGLKLSSEGKAALEKAVFARLSFKEEALLPAAHPEALVGWTALFAALEKALPEAEPSLTEDERTRLRDLMTRWKPR